MANNGPEVVYVEDQLDYDTTATKSKRGAYDGGWWNKPAIDPDLEAEAKEWLTADEIRDRGAFRSDEFKSPWWLDIKQLIAFERKNSELPDTDDGNRSFWDWFRTYRLSERLTSNRGGVSWRDQIGSSYTPATNNLTHWWSNAGYDSAGSDRSRKLAIAIGAVKTTVSVIQSSVKRYRVEFASESSGATNYTNFDEQIVVVSPEAILDTSLSDDDAIEITTGYGLHEASHIEYTEPIVSCLLDPDEIQPMALAKTILNIIEDARIEQRTSDKFPGFASYFGKMLDHLWQTTKDHAPTAYSSDLTARVNAMLASVRWPSQYESTARADPQLSADFDWYADWIKRYLDDDIEPRQAIIDCIDHFKLDEQTQQQLDELQQQQDNVPHSPFDSLTDEQLSNQLDELARELGMPAHSGCPSPKHIHGKNAKLDDSVAEEVQELVEGELHQDDPVITMIDSMGNNLGGPTITWFKPPLSDAGKFSYRKPDGLVQRMKSAFFFRKALPQFSERLLKTGQVDDEEVWRFGAGDYRIFENRITPEQPDANVVMLVDMSGSMAGSRTESAQDLANTMLECLTTMRGIRTSVRGHTSAENEAHGGDCMIYRLWEQGDPKQRIGLINSLWHGWNYDGFAIDAVCQEMLKSQRPREQMVLFVLSDGKPNARRFVYSGMPAMDHVRQVVDYYAKRGITVIQIAIDPEMRVGDQSRMYRYWIPFSDRQKLPAQLTSMLIKLFGSDQ